VISSWQTMVLFILIDIFYPSGKPNASNLIYCQKFAVEGRSFIPGALPLRLSQLVNNPG